MNQVSCDRQVLHFLTVSSFLFTRSKRLVFYTNTLIMKNWLSREQTYKSQLKNQLSLSKTLLPRRN